MMFLQSEPLFSYNCTLTTFKTPSIASTTEDLPALYSKSAPSYALGGSGIYNVILVAFILLVLLENVGTVGKQDEKISMHL